MLGFKRFRTAAVTIAGIELLRRIHKGQFNLGRLRLKDRARPPSGMRCWRRRKMSPIEGMRCPDFICTRTIWIVRADYVLLRSGTSDVEPSARLRSFIFPGIKSNP
jgi:hypothetical protein